MPYDDRRKLMTPDFYPEPQQGWVDFPEDQPVDMGPAAGAFQQRFMQPKPQSVPSSGTHEMGHMDTGRIDPSFSTAADLGMNVNAPKGKGLKSL